MVPVVYLCFRWPASFHKPQPGIAIYIPENLRVEAHQDFYDEEKVGLLTHWLI